MKLSNNIKNISKAFIAALILSAVMVSCSKDKDIVYQPVSILNVIHASPTAEKLDFFLDTKKANSEVSNVDFKYTDKTGYLRIYTGSRDFSINKKGNATTLLTKKFTFEDQTGYSLFIANKLENVEFLLLKDDLTIPAPGKARVRFVNLSPDEPALSLAIDGQAADLFTNKAFKEYSTFENIDAAPKVTFKIKENGTNTVVTTLADVRIDAGKIYTIWVKGLKTTADDNLKVGAVAFQH